MTTTLPEVTRVNANCLALIFCLYVFPGLSKTPPDKHPAVKLELRIPAPGMRFSEKTAIFSIHVLGEEVNAGENLRAFWRLGSLKELDADLSAMAHPLWVPMVRVNKQKQGIRVYRDTADVGAFYCQRLGAALKQCEVTFFVIRQGDEKHILAARSVKFTVASE